MELLIDSPVVTTKRLSVDVKVVSGGLLDHLRYVRAGLSQYVDDAGFRMKGAWTLERLTNGWMRLSRPVEPRDWPPRF